jgi:lantibiotic modifying enzyme
MPEGIGWLVPGYARPLTGFSHGAAGIAWALLNVSEVTNDERFHDASRKAYRYEQSLFSPTHGNWPDLRCEDTADAVAPDATRFMAAWCHGATGIGLARMLSMRFGVPAAESEARTALHTTVREGFGRDHSLCHGDLGNIDVLLQGADLLADSDLRQVAYRRAAAVLRDIERHGSRCGVAAGVQSPGLMTGLAGIGYGFLRLVDEARVPSVLCLA